MKLTYWDRYKKNILEDKVYADSFILWCYESSIGQFFLKILFSKRPINYLYGVYKNSALSKKQIPIDIEEYQIDMNLFKDIEFNSYSDFFLREFKEGARNFVKEESILGAFGEGRYLGFEKVTDELRFPVKGKDLNSFELLESKQYANMFDGGPILICRLCPIDYHHFHYPTDGKIIDRYKIHGSYHSVNVHALRNKSDIFIENEREITIIETKNFGKLAFIEVGAMCVGKISQDNPNSSHCFKGERKGHFEFGGSTLILLGQAGMWKPANDILEHSAKNRESFIMLGDYVGERT